MEVYTKESLICSLQAIARSGWIPNARPGNAGGVGNTLEDLLGIEENNLPVANAAEWELKCQRAKSKSLTTLFHMEPSPTAVKFVPRVFLPKYGWSHKEAGMKYPANEMSFRQTISAVRRTDRGFMVIIDRQTRRVLVSFDAASVNPRHSAWLATVERRAGLAELDPQPYWGFHDLFHKFGTKLRNCFYLRAETRKEEGREFYRYSTILMLEELSLDGLLTAIEEGNVLVDFDARTKHNHGTKFRVRQDKLPGFYSRVTKLV